RELMSARAESRTAAACSAVALRASKRRERTAARAYAYTRARSSSGVGIRPRRPPRAAGPAPIPAPTRAPRGSGAAIPAALSEVASSALGGFIVGTKARGGEDGGAAATAGNHIVRGNLEGPDVQRSTHAQAPA